MFRNRQRAGLAALLFLLLLFGGLSARRVHGEEKPAPPGSGAAAPADAEHLPQQRPIRVEVPLVLVNVSVIDPYNRFVTGLDPEHFEIYEDKKLQKVAHFSTEDVPISVGILFDASGSMSDKIDKARMAVSQFFRTSNPEDEFFLIDFSDRPQLRSDFTRDAIDLQNKLTFT